MPLRWALALFGLGLGLPLALRVWLGLWGAMGTDAALWGGSALDLAAGNPVLVPPAYPALIALLRALGVQTVPAGWAVSTLAAAAVPVLVALLGRRWGLSPGLTALGALLVMVHPELLTLAQQVQPDALLWAALLGLALLLDDDAPRPAWGAAVLAGLLPLLREHGLPLGLLTGLVLGLRRRRDCGADHQANNSNGGKKLRVQHDKGLIAGCRGLRVPAAASAACSADCNAPGGTSSSF